MSDMEDFLGKQIANAYKPDPTFDKLNNAALKNTNAEQQNALNQKSSYVIELEQQVSKLRKQLTEAEQNAAIYMAKFRKSEQAVNQYKSAYAENMYKLAEWMVSQKAFKELAIQYGLKAGISVEDTYALGISKKIDVLKSKHNPEHNTNSSNSEVISPYRQKLIDKLNNKG